MKNSGFKPPVIEEKHYVLGQGNVPLEALQKDGDWVNSLPEEEKQFVPNFDTYNCTGFGSTNLVEIYMLKRFGIKCNFSDRWVGIIAGTDPQSGGNDPHTVLEAIREYGLIPEEMLPFSDDIRSAEDYFSFKGADKEACYEAGRKWKEKYNFKHEWVFRPDEILTGEQKINYMQIALKYSPLGIAVYAWQLDGRGVYVSLGTPNHWTSVYAIKNFLENIFDSYDPYKKVSDQPVVFCKRISIEEKVVTPSSSTLDIGSIIINFLKKIWPKIFQQQ